MSTITLPSGFVPNAFSLRQSTVQRSHGSPFGGSEQVVDLLNDRWLISMSLAPRKFTEAARFEAFIAALRGMTNTCNLYHYARPVPRGTMRGTPTTSFFLQGSDSMNLTVTAGATLLAGDMVGAGGLLLQVRSDCTADGAGLITVPLVNRLRKSLAFGTAVIWDRPTAPFRMVSESAMQYVPGYAEGVSLDFVEVIV